MIAKIYQNTFCIFCYVDLSKNNISLYLPCCSMLILLFTCKFDRLWGTRTHGMHLQSLANIGFANVRFF